MLKIIVFWLKKRKVYETKIVGSFYTQWVTDFLDLVLSNYKIWTILYTLRRDDILQKCEWNFANALIIKPFESEEINVMSKTPRFFYFSSDFQPFLRKSFDM